MTVADAERLDLVLSKDGKVVLAMVESRPWDGSPERREEVRKKIAAYLGFLRSDGFRERFGDPTGASILLLAGTEPPEDIATLMANASRASGVEITFQQGAPTPPSFVNREA